MNDYILGGRKRSKDDYAPLMDRIRSGKPFYFPRFNDGERDIMRGRRQNRLHKPGWLHAGDHSGWRYYPGQEVYEKSRVALNAAWDWRHPNYVHGIGSHQLLAQAKEDGITEHYHATVFIDQFQDVYERWGEYFSDRKTVMVAHRKAVMDHLQFKDQIVQHIPTPPDILAHSDEMLAEVLSFAETHQEGYMWLFCAGPWTNIAIHALAQKYPLNQFLDVGSVFDPIMGLGLTRGQLSRQLSGYKHESLGILVPKSVWSRGMAIADDDMEVLHNYIREHQCTRVIEAGPGRSTGIFLEYGCEVVALEANGDYAQKVRDEYKQYGDQLRVIHYTKWAEGLGLSQSEADFGEFDFGFVDGPRGARRFSRLHTCQFISQRCPVWCLHDTKRSGEKQTIGWFTERGWLAEDTGTQRGLTLVTKEKPPVE